MQDFLKNVAWHYDIVDEATFINQLAQWGRLTHDQFKGGPDALPATLIYNDGFRSFHAIC